MERMKRTPEKCSNLILLGLLTALVLGAHSSAIYGSFSVLDDQLLLLDSPASQELSLSSLKDIFLYYDPELYIPFTLLSFHIEYQFFGSVSALPYHLMNLVLHLLNALLVFTFLLLLTKRRGIAFFCALLWGIHPLNTEAVSWIAARKDLLSTFFSLALLIAYYKERSNGSRFLPFSHVLFLFALLSKVSAFTLPLLLLLIDYREEGARGLKMLKNKWMFFLLSFIFLFIGLQAKFLSVYQLSYLETFLLASKGTVFYLQKLLWPTGLSILYPFTETISLLSPDFLFPVLILVCLFWIVLLSRVFTREVFFGFFFFLFALLPNLSNFSKGVNSYIFFASDRYVYLASLGIIYLVCIGGAVVYERYRVVRIWRVLGVVVLAGTVGVLSLLTYVQGLYWQDTVALYQKTLVHYPESSLAHVVLGGVYLGEEEYDKAAEEFELSLALRDDDLLAQMNLGYVYTALERYQEAERVLKRAVEQAPEEIYPHLILAAAYTSQGKFAAAHKELSLSKELEPQNAIPYYLYGILFEEEGKKDLAIIAYRQAIALDPEYLAARSLLAGLL